MNETMRVVVYSNRQKNRTLREIDKISTQRKKGHRNKVRRERKRNAKIAREREKEGGRE